jgi:hypothetical protein
VRRLTVKEVKEQYGGILPPDAVFRSDDDEKPIRPATTAKPKRRNGRGERFATLNAFADIGMAGLTGAEAKVWLILFRDTKAATGTARTGQNDMARRAGLSVRAIKKAIQTLKAKGMITITYRGRLNAGPSIYRVHSTGLNWGP